MSSQQAYAKNSLISIRLRLVVYETPLFLQLLIFVFALNFRANNMKGVSANIMCGQQGYYGTNCFKVLIDNDFLMSIKPQSTTLEPNDDSDEQSLLNQISSETSNECSTNSLLIESSVASIKNINNGTSNDYELDF